MFAGTVRTDEAVKTYREMVNTRYLSGAFWLGVHYAITKMIEMDIDTTDFPERSTWDSMSMASAYAFMLVKAARSGDRPTSFEGNRHYAYDYALSLISSDRNNTKVC